MKLIGPFKQLVTLSDLPLKGPISDSQLEIIENAGLIIEKGFIKEIGIFKDLIMKARDMNPVNVDMVAVPGFIDCHTHICFGGSRASDYALRVAGATYQEILAKGGGIHDSVSKTRKTDQATLEKLLRDRVIRHTNEGVTTIEVKSGYGLSVNEEVKMLEAIKSVNQELPTDLIATCLAAHVVPGEFKDAEEYVQVITKELFPILKEKSLAKRVDVFVEENAFDLDQSKAYLSVAKAMGFDLTLHADQFSTGGSQLAVALEAKSADHLEASGKAEIKMLAKSNVVSTVLPGASLGLGMHYAPARKLLDAGACVAIATDWNPGSAPMGDLLLQTALMGASEKLSVAESLAGITYRAAHALSLKDRGVLIPGMLADIAAFPTSDYREIFYQQGKLKPEMVWKRGDLI